MESATEIAICKAADSLDRIATCMETVIKMQVDASNRSMDGLMEEAMKSFAKANPVFGDAIAEMERIHTQGRQDAIGGS